MMMNIGVEINNKDKGTIEEKMLRTLNPDNISYEELFKKKYISISKGELIDRLILAPSEEFYIEYTKGIKSKIFLSKKEELVEVLLEKINPERCEGLDLVISPCNFSFIVVTNHDGDIFLILNQV